MEKYTQKQLKGMVKSGIATDVSWVGSYESRKKAMGEEPDGYDQVGYSSGIYGINGMLLKGRTTNKLYAITSRCSAIYVF